MIFLFPVVIMSVVLSDAASDLISHLNETAESPPANSSTLCSNLAQDAITEGCRFWIQGILICVVGIFGIVGNMVSGATTYHALLFSMHSNSSMHPQLRGSNLTLMTNGLNRTY